MADQEKYVYRFSEGTREMKDLLRIEPDQLNQVLHPYIDPEANPDLKLGICGKHGGDPDSIASFHEAGLDYDSCSPYRVPIARLAAAQAALTKD